MSYDCFHCGSKFPSLYHADMHDLDCGFEEEEPVKVWGLNKAGLEMALLLTNVKYGDNLKFSREPQYKNNTHWVFTLKVKDSGRVGARRGPPPKNLARPHVCWHAYRDFYITVFKICPQARVKTVHIDYKGKEHFERSFESTGKEHVGGGEHPVFQLKNACNCKDFA